MIKQLQPTDLRKTCALETLEALTNHMIVSPRNIIGQQRAEKALELGLGIKAEGFNVYVSGPQGSGKLTAVKSFLETAAENEPTPFDWCYVNNFEDAYQPTKISLPPGRGLELKKDMKNLVHESLQALMKVFESEDYAKRRQAITDKFEEQQSNLTSTITDKAASESLLIKQTPWEVFTIPLRNGEPMNDKEFNRLPEKEQEAIRKKQESFAEEIKNVLQQTRKLEKEAQKEYTKLDNELAGYAITALIREIEEEYRQLPEVLAYLKNVKNDILNNLSEFLLSQKPAQGLPIAKGSDFLKRYEVNVLIDNTRQKGAPIVIERNPTYNNLIGRVEKESMMGTLVTDFTMIRKGSLHSANGGYLIIRAEELFKNYFSWEALKRAIRNKEIMIEEATDQLGYMTTKTLKPESIPLHVKVILVGNAWYYHLLYALDNDFKILFKVRADFDPEMDRTPENTGNYMHFARVISEKEQLLKPDTAALAKVIEYGARLAEDKEKLSTRFDEIADILREANQYAAQSNAPQISGTHIQKAIEEKLYRSNLIQQKYNDMIRQQQILVDITGTKTGQVNGLSVISMGDITFGKPSRITCSINLGKSGIIAVEREAELSGPIHTKGVLILSGYLGAQFFQDKPVSLSARLVFEQSYGEVEGDSASSTELYALLSSLAKLPIKQGIAVTGSINQRGEVQAIGGVNEKIEGYFELCKIVGLNGEQGVIIPAANTRNLMLKEDITEAVRNNQFHIWSVDTVEDGIEILTGVKAGSLTEKDTVFYRVNQMLLEYAFKMREFEGDAEETTKPNSQDKWVSSVVKPAKE